MHTRINKKNTIYLRLTLVVLLSLVLLLLSYALHPAYVKAVDEVVSTYRTTFPSEQMEKKDPLKVVVDPNSSEKEIVEEARALKQEKHQEVTILTYHDSDLQSEEPTSEKELKYKAETTSEGVKIKDFYSNKNVVSDTALSRQWDVSKNNFDLVSGLLTIQLTIEEGLSPDAILAQSKGLVELLLTYNTEKEIQAIEFEIKSGKENYSFESVNADTLINTKMIYTN